MFPCLCLFYAHVYPMLVYIPSPCSFHLHVICVYHIIMFITCSCLTVCRLYPALVLKDHINFNITTEYLKPFFQSISTEIKSIYHAIILRYTTQYKLKVTKNLDTIESKEHIFSIITKPIQFNLSFKHLEKGYYITPFNLEVLLSVKYRAKIT